MTPRDYTTIYPIFTLLNKHPAQGVSNTHGMEYLLPFLLGLIFLGIKHYNKTQKDRKTSPIIQEQALETSSSVDEFIQQFYSQEESITAPSISTSNIKEYDQQESWMEKKHQEEPESIEYTDETSRKIKHKSQFETIQNKEGQTAERFDIDLKKAIIYDAILNPPYI